MQNFSVNLLMFSKTYYVSIIFSKIGGVLFVRNMCVLTSVANVTALLGTFQIKSEMMKNFQTSRVIRIYSP